MSESFEIIVPEKPQRIEQLVCEELEDQGSYVYIHEEDGTTMTLNPTASAIFDMCDGETTAEAMAEVLVDIFELPHDDALRDVKDILAELSGFGFFTNAD
jgi:hypothetical protein